MNASDLYQMGIAEIEPIARSAIASGDRKLLEALRQALATRRVPRARRLLEDVIAAWSWNERNQIESADPAARATRSDDRDSGSSTKGREPKRFSLHLWSEPFRASGGVAAHGVKNALGRPHMPLPTLLVREAVQNSWDAGIPTGTRPVRFSLDGGLLKDYALRNLRRALCDSPSPGLELRTILARDEVPVLFVSDRGTTGLGGPTRADIHTDSSHDFVDFLRNVGQPPDKERGGGTYGYGKAVLYLASSASTIVVWSRCRWEGKIESRLIGVGLGDPYDQPGAAGIDLNYTGRHWWGIADEEVGAEPLLDQAADEAAEMLGFPPFEDGELGTTVMIVGADLGTDCLREGLQHAAESILWHCWPKMILRDGADVPDMEFSVRHDGEDIVIPPPESHPVIAPFVDAFRLAEGSIESVGILSRTHEIRCERPRQSLGQLGLVIASQRPLAGKECGSEFDGSPHHIALMRAPGLVVTYLEGPDSPVPDTSWAGVFIADDAVDRAFAKAEPPSHDEWSPDLLPTGHEKRFVNVGLRRLKEFAKAFTQPGAGSDPDQEVLSLGAIAGALGGLLVDQSGPGAWNPPAPTSNDPTVDLGERGRQSGLRSRRPRRPRITADAGILVVEGDKVVLRVPFTVDGPVGRVRLKAVASVTTDGGMGVEQEGPLGAARPQVDRWEIDDRVLDEVQPILELGSSLEGTVFIEVPVDAEISVTLKVEVLPPTVENDGQD